MNGMMTLTPASGTAARRPGDTVDLIATWDLPQTPTSLTVLLSWWTSGKGTTDAAAVWSEDLALSAKGEKQVSVPLPAGPYSFSGRLISLKWKIELVANKDVACGWELTL